MAVGKGGTPIQRQRPGARYRHADARLQPKGNTASELRYLGHTLAEGRHGLIANAIVRTSCGYAEPEVATVIVADAKQAADQTAQITLGADKRYHAAEFVAALVTGASELYQPTMQSKVRTTLWV